jgi:AraC-like DNA-binding protein
VGSLVIRLGYGGSLALFGLDPQAVRNRIVPAEQFLCSEITVLLSSFELTSQNEWARRLARHLNVNAAPTKRLTQAKHLTDRAIDLMDSCPSIRGVCHRLQISHTSLSAATKMATGLRPYEILRLRRFRAVAEEFRAGTRPVGDAEGFADQSHLIREFRTLSMSTPRRYVDNPTLHAGHVSMANE